MGNYVKKRREDLGLTQDELAIKAGLSRQTISSIENGTNRGVTSSTLTKIATALDTTVGALFFKKSV